MIFLKSLDMTIKLSNAKVEPHVAGAQSKLGVIISWSCMP